MRPVLINGLGCLEGGSRQVLRELVASAPVGVRLWVILPWANRGDVSPVPAGVRRVALSHRVFGRWMRPAFELGLFMLAALGCFGRVVNLSNYGLCAPSWTPTALYYHNAFLIEDGRDYWSGEGGRPNWFKRWCLDSCLRRAEVILVQTEFMAARLEAYARRRNVRPARIEVVRPRIETRIARVPAQRVFPFQFFYPASAFAHKRVELAIRATVEANRVDSRIGLVVTSAATREAMPCIRALGTVSDDCVLGYLATSRALLFTSSAETLGLPLLEAMASGLPAVLPELPYARDVYGDAGVYFEGDDVGSVAGAMLECVRQYEARSEQVTERREREFKRRVSWAEHWKEFGVR